MLVDFADGREVGRSEAALEQSDPFKRARDAAGLGIDFLICGAVSWPLELALTSAGVQIVPHTCGNIEEVLAAFLGGQLKGGAFLMPGCCGRRRRSRAGRRRGRRRSGQSTARESFGGSEGV